MITEHTRACACGKMLPAEPPFVCASCSRVEVPLVAEWPDALMQWLIAMQIRKLLAPMAKATPQRRYERLLTSIIAGETWRARLVPRTASAVDCYTVASEMAAKWEANGRPSLF